jgi:predicted  nucleic acid-binding Zn-ribbon protein
MERQHTIDIEDLHARLRVESQTIEDNILNYSRKLTAIEIDVSDSRRRLDKELAQLDQMRQENQALRVNVVTMTHNTMELNR